jgi:hypothetical protein
LDALMWIFFPVDVVVHLLVVVVLLLPLPLLLLLLLLLLPNKATRVSVLDVETTWNAPKDVALANAWILVIAQMLTGKTCFVPMVLRKPSNPPSHLLPPSNLLPPFLLPRASRATDGSASTFLDKDGSLVVFPRVSLHVSQRMPKTACGEPVKELAEPSSTISQEIKDPKFANLPDLDGARLSRTRTRLRLVRL